MKELISFIVENIVQAKDKFSIEEELIQENYTKYTIKADQEDIGKIIGKNGKVIQAIRNIAKILAVKENKHIRIEIS